MTSVNFDEDFGFVGGVVKFEAEFEGNHFIGPAVKNEDGAFSFSDEFDSGVVEASEPANGHIGIKLLADICVGGKGAFDDEAGGFDFGGEVSGDTAAEGPAENDNAVGNDTFLFSKPPEGGADVEVGAVFGGPAVAFAVAAEVKDKAVEAELI